MLAVSWVSGFGMDVALELLACGTPHSDTTAAFPIRPVRQGFLVQGDSGLCCSNSYTMTPLWERVVVYLTFV